MIQNGEAQVAAGIEDVLAAVDLDSGLRLSPGGTGSPASARDLLARRVRDAVPAHGVITADAIVCATGLSEADVSRALVCLVDDGDLEYGHDGWRLTAMGRRRS